jgi:hypothetical protein
MCESNLLTVKGVTEKALKRPLRACMLKEVDITHLIKSVTSYGVTDCGEVNTELMGAPVVRVEAQERVAARERCNGLVGSTGTAGLWQGSGRLIHGLATAHHAAGIGPERQLDGTSRGLGGAAHDGQIGALDSAFLLLSCERAQRRLIEGDQEHSRSAGIEPMDEAGRGKGWVVLVA